MVKNTEIELKLLLSREGLEKMLQLDFMQQAMRPDSYKKRRLVSTYYDTADMADAAWYCLPCTRQRRLQL